MTKVSASSLMATMLALGLVVPAAAQQSSNLHYYMLQFEWKDSQVKAMTESPQDRQAPTRKLFKAYGGKLVNYFVIPGTNGGVVIAEFPDILALQAVTMEIGARGALAKFQWTPLITTEDSQMAMQKVKDTRSGYTTPEATGSSTPPSTGTTK